MSDQERWYATFTKTRDALYEAKRALTVPEIIEVTGCKDSTIRTHLARLIEDGRVVRLPGRPAFFVHKMWVRKKL